jgi:hypothetical protein
VERPEPVILTDREDLETEVSDLHAELDELRETLDGSETNEADLAVVIDEQQASQAQFELYEHQDAE